MWLLLAACASAPGTSHTVIVYVGDTDEAEPSSSSSPDDTGTPPTGDDDDDDDDDPPAPLTTFEITGTLDGVAFSVSTTGDGSYLDSPSYEAVVTPLTFGPFIASLTVFQSYDAQVDNEHLFGPGVYDLPEPGAGTYRWCSLSLVAGVSIVVNGLDGSCSATVETWDPVALTWSGTFTASGDDPVLMSASGWFEGSLNEI